MNLKIYTNTYVSYLHLIRKIIIFNLNINQWENLKLLGIKIVTEDKIKSIFCYVCVCHHSLFNNKIANANQLNSNVSSNIFSLLLIVNFYKQVFQKSFLLIRKCFNCLKVTLFSIVEQENYYEILIKTDCCAIYSLIYKK